MAAYFIFRHSVSDADKLNNDYLPKAVETLGSYAPEILVVDENIEVIEGNTEDTRCVVLKFKDKDEHKGVVLLGLFTHGPGLIHTSKPIGGVGDVKGLKIRQFCIQIR